jgi:alpha-glucosidase (family GH31 glycosyl hydrolase)
MFPGARHLFGLPERVDKFVLKTTENKDPYRYIFILITIYNRLYNLDVFPHSVYEPEGTYGSVPYLTAHTAEYDASVIWMNAAETWVDIFK